MPGILIVDDEELSRIAIRKLLSRLFPDILVVGEAESGRLAVEMSESLRPDIVLMDIKIPGINGIEASERILLALPSVRIIILTAYDSFGFAQRAINMGLSGYLLKPASEAEFAEVVGKALSEVRKSGQAEASADVMQGQLRPIDARVRIELAIAARPLRELGLDGLADDLSTSPQYLSRLFKELFGLKFVEYATVLKIDAAKEILETEKITVEDLGRRLGWSDSAHFSRLFRERTGLTPKAYARAFTRRAGGSPGES
jgi:YesN/AraC family two-component response regulator